MSIATRTGDNGTTGLMYNHRVPKTHPRVEACGAIDELNAALGVARAAAEEAFTRDALLPVQRDLITLMGELAVLPEDLERYTRDRFPRATRELVAKLDAVVQEIETQDVSFKGWATPGANASSAAFDMARTICRRAERAALRVFEQDPAPNMAVIIYLNRLSDALWLMARWTETQVEKNNL